MYALSEDGNINDIKFLAVGKKKKVYKQRNKGGWLISVSFFRR